MARLNVDIVKFRLLLFRYFSLAASETNQCVISIHAYTWLKEIICINCKAFSMSGLSPVTFIVAVSGRVCLHGGAA